MLFRSGGADLKTVFAKLTAKIGGEDLVLTEDGGGTGFTFPFPVLVTENYLLSVLHEDVGYAKNDIVMINVLKISSISPQTGSKYGTRLTITGNGFPPTGIAIKFGTAGKLC